MKETEIIGALAALAHPVRLKVFRALVVSGSQGLTPGVHPGYGRLGPPEKPTAPRNPARRRAK